MKYYIDSNGNYLGGSDSVPLSVNEVPFAPDNAAYIWNGVNYDVPPPTKQEFMQLVSTALQNVLDTEAAKLGYDNINTIVSYADESAVPSFQSEGQSFRAWRSNVWAYAYATLAQYDADVAQYSTDKATYDTAKTQYDIDYAQWLVDVVADPTIVVPAAPIAPAAVAQPTINGMVINMPVRV